MDYLTDLLFLDRLARSGDPVTREAVELARLRVIHKYGFDPSQPRDITGQWSAGGTTTTVTPSRADAQRQREANAEAAATGRLADARDSAAADAAIRAATPETPKGATQAADGDRSPEGHPRRLDETRDRARPGARNAPRSRHPSRCRLDEVGCEERALGTQSDSRARVTAPLDLRPAGRIVTNSDGTRAAVLDEPQQARAAATASRND